MSIVVLVVIIVAVGLLGAGIVGFVGAKQKSYPFSVNSFRALQIANAGMEAAIRRALDTSNLANGTIGTSGSQIDLCSGCGKFYTNYNSGTDILTSFGTFSNVSRVVTLTNFSSYASSPSGDVTFDTDIASFSPMESQSGQAISVNTTTKVISLGQGVTETFGAVWYGGNNVAGNCVNGSCDFDNGFRSYFVFQFATGSTGDGFTFAVISGNTGYNNASSVGGDTSMGELMAYGGDSRKYDSSSPYTNDISLFADHKGLGIRPPKFATEFDIYYNADGTVCAGAGSRRDTAANHMAYVFWGDNSLMGCAPEDVSIYLRWMPSMVYALNTVVHPATPNGYIYRATTAGQSGAAAPTWPTARGGSVTESCTTPPCVRWQEVSWRPNPQTFAVGNIVAPTTVGGSFNPAASNGHFYRCTSASGNKRSGNSEPAWCKGSGCTVTDNNVVWTLYATNVAFPGNSRTYDDNRHVDVGTGGNTGSSAGTGPTNTTTSESYYSIPAWSASTAYAVGSQVKPGTNNGYYYTVQTAGTSGGTQPGWPASGTITDGTVVWVPIAIIDPSYWLANVTDATAINPKYAYRMEVIRNSGARTYRIKSWIKTCTDGTANCDMYTNGTFGNVDSDYALGSATLDRTITLNSTYNTAFSKFLFGWTVAAGGATQIADVRKFRMKFKP
ncbi:MAG: hypothetical protein C0392_09525 [Syntrophus sp. (in: bacteria)]|nr:hypothetical protein [Syntrophus sp. (in: bacteria)]